MDLNRLEEFRIIAEERSIKKAAERLEVAPSVLSSRLKSFEKSLSTTLFNRSPKELTLTESGKLLLQNADDLLSSYKNTLQTLHEIGTNEYRSLTIAICGLDMAPRLGIFLDRYNRTHPNLHLNLLSDQTYSLMEGLSSGAVDVFVTMTPEENLSSPFESFSFFHTSNLSVYVANDHPLATRSEISFSELDGETFLLYPDTAESCIRKIQLNFLEKSGINYSIYPDMYDACFCELMVPIGKGIFLDFTSEKNPPNTSVLKISDAGYDVYTHMVYKKDSTNETTMDFIESFKQYLKEGR